MAIKEQEQKHERKQKNVITFYGFWKLPFLPIFSLLFVSMCFYLLPLYASDEDFLFQFQHKPIIRIPDAMEPIQGVVVNTSQPGTVDHPTINGGIISATMHLSRNEDQQFFLKQRRQPAHVTQPTQRTSTIKQKPFADEWATSEKVRQLLILATAQGKLNYVLKKTKQMGLPASVAVVPMVESNYQTDALSPKGAAGAWQLMPSVAKDYGIQTQERFQFRTSTDTALKLLNHLHQQFGNWELAFAAYNAGSKRVITALQKNPNAKTIDALDLPQETKIYVKRIRGLNKTLWVLANHAT
jgi:hypothetical protein